MVYSVIVQITTMFNYVCSQVEKDEMTFGVYRTYLFFQIHFLQKAYTKSLYK